MKKQLMSYLAGAATTALLIALPASVLAASGRLTIEVDPVSVQVNGELFKPTDANGEPVPVFAYNGTTYAPLRALAEAYGLEVGYNSTVNMATVHQPVLLIGAGQYTQELEPEDTQPAVDVDFASQWTVTKKMDSPYSGEVTYDAVYSGPMNMTEFKAWWKSMDMADIETKAEEMMAETGCGTGVMYFTYNGKMLGQAGSLNGYIFSNFRIASIWIK